MNEIELLAIISELKHILNNYGSDYKNYNGKKVKCIKEQSIKNRLSRYEEELKAIKTVTND